LLLSLVIVDWGRAVWIKKPTTVASRGLMSKFFSATTNTRGVVSYNDDHPQDSLPSNAHHDQNSIRGTPGRQAEIFPCSAIQENRSEKRILSRLCAALKAMVAASRRCASASPR
jgi:hypothetical protein